MAESGQKVRGWRTIKILLKKKFMRGHECKKPIISSFVPVPAGTFCVIFNTEKWKSENLNMTHVM